VTTPQPRIAVITAAQRRVIVEVMRTGAEGQQVAKTLGLAKGTVFNHLTAVKEAAGEPTLLSLALALERGQVKLRTRTDKRRQP